MSQRTCRTADILLAVPAPGEWVRGPLVQLGLLCGALDTIPLGRMILQLLARSLSWPPSSNSKPFPSQSWPVILLLVDARPRPFSESLYVRSLLKSWVFSVVCHLSP